jgi:hypothetical protein
MKAYKLFFTVFMHNAVSKIIDRPESAENEQGPAALSIRVTCVVYP